MSAGYAYRMLLAFIIRKAREQKSRPGGRPVLLRVHVSTCPRVPSRCAASRLESSTQAERAGDVVRLAVAGGVDGEAQQGVGRELVIYVEAEAGLVLGRR